MSEESQARAVRTVRLKIIKPLNMDWDKLGEILRDTRWRTWQLANMVINDQAVFWSMKKQGKVDECAKLFGWHTSKDGKVYPATIDQQNQKLGEQLRSKGIACDGGAVNGYITGALNQRLNALLKGTHWSSFTRGERTLPTMRLDMPIPLRGGAGKFDPIRWSDEHEGFVLSPRLTLKPYPELLVGPSRKDTSANEWIQKLADNPEQSLSGWRQRSFEIKEDESGSWWITIAYDRPAQKVVLDHDVVCGVKVAYNVPLTMYCDGDFRGEKEFGWIGKRIAALRSEVDQRRRSIQFGGRRGYAVRSGRGRKRKLQPIEILRGRIDDAQTTYNHIMSSMVVDFAMLKEAWTIQIEDLGSLKDVLRGTFLGTNWRYHQLQQMIEYKAKDYGIRVVKVNPAYTVKRCSCCGHINESFDKSKSDRYACENVQCQAFSDSLKPDWNAAINLSIANIDEIVEHQLKSQKKEEKHGKKKVIVG